MAATDEESYEKYREKLSPGKLFPEDHEILRKLWDRYDTCSKYSHPSLFSLSRHIETQRSETDFNITFNYFELKNDDLSEPVRTLLWTLDAHFGVLQVFEEVFEDVLAYDRTKWEIQKNAVDGKIVLHKEKWKAIILS